MQKTIIPVPRGIKFIGNWQEFGSYIPSGHVIINKQLTGCGFTEWLLTNDIPTIWVAPRKCLLGNKESQHNKYEVREDGKLVCSEQNLYYVRSIIEELEIDKDLQKVVVRSKAVDTKLAVDDEKQDIDQSTLENNITQAYNRFLYEGKCPKFCVTYDSFRRLKEVLQKYGLFDQFVVAVDEFQVIFQDQRFKANTEMEFMWALSQCPNVIFVSATPMIEEYLDQIDEFKNLPYIEIDWRSEEPGRVITPKINAFPCKSINKIAKKYIEDLKAGKYAKKVLFDPSTGQPGQTIESKELVIYVNSIRNICDIIKKNSLTWQDTCVICADSSSNRKKIRDAFKQVHDEMELDKSLLPSLDQIISTPPKKGESRKPITLCSKTAYIGSDMYSDCARTLILSDSTVECLSVDITLDLPQIMGRQRMENNPWKYEADLYYHIGVGAKQISKEEFEKKIEEKQRMTQDLLDAYNTANQNSKHSLAVTYLRMVNDYNYRDNYIAVNQHAGSDLKPQINNLVMIAEKRAFDIQQVDYANRFSVMAAIDDLSNVDLSEFTEEIAKFMIEFNKLSQFQDKMRFACSFSSGLNKNSIEYFQFLKTIPNDIAGYINELGEDYISGHGYQRSKLEEEYQRRAVLLHNPDSLVELIYSSFSIGEKLSNSDIKEKLSEIYNNLSLDKTAKAKDLEQWFELRKTQISNKETGKRDNGFEILSIK